MQAPAEGRLRAADAMLPRPFRVLARRRETADTVTLGLGAVDRRPLGFAAGQFTMLLAFGVGDVPLSICGDPNDPGLLQHTIRDVGGVTASLAAAEPGRVLGVRGPFGTGWSVADGAGGDVLVVAGGIGLAPLRPVILELAAARERYRRVTVLYGARTPDDVLFGAELQGWRVDHQVDVSVSVDRATTPWSGRVGLVTDLIPNLIQARFDPDRTLALVCGPEVMMRHAATALTGCGVPADRIRLSMERTMQCGVGLCGHCQLREHFVCVDGPVFGLDRIQPLLTVREL